MSHPHPLLQIARLVCVALATLMFAGCPDDATGPAGDPDMAADATDDAGVDVDDDTVSCVPGSEGCACSAGGVCDAADDEGNALVCSAGNVCVEEGATDCTGELGCLCGEGDTCDDGLSCTGGVCELSSGLVLAIDAGEARACDLRIESRRVIAGAFFPDGVRGELRARDTAAAIALMRTEDTALDGAIVTLALEGDEPAAEDDIESLSATCYGRLGSIDAEAVPTLQVLSE